MIVAIQARQMVSDISILYWGAHSVKLMEVDCE